MKTVLFLICIFAFVTGCSATTKLTQEERDERRERISDLRNNRQ